MEKKKKIKIIYLIIIHAVVVYNVYNHFAPEPLIRDYSPTFCYNGEKCANTFDQYKVSREAELLLKESYLIEQGKVLYKELDTVQGVISPNLIEQSSIISD
jgi:hypothetical protein